MISVLCKADSKAVLPRNIILNWNCNKNFHNITLHYIPTYEFLVNCVYYNWKDCNSELKISIQVAKID